MARGIAPGGWLTCLALEPEYAANARGNLEAAGVADRVDVVVGPALRWLERIPEEPRFDFVFLDADKESYPHYYELLLPRMRPNALLLLDNTLLGGRVLDPPDERARTVAALNDAIAQDERVDSAMTFVVDGLTFVRKR